nr:uncharacterized protein LOC109165874 [Ipomoea trifida]
MSSNHSSASFWQILSDQENALKAEMENLKKVKEWVGEIEEWKMTMKREMEELKTEKKEVEERVKVCEERFVWLERRVAHIEENVAYLAAMLLRNVDGTISPNKEGLYWLSISSTAIQRINLIGICQKYLNLLLRILQCESAPSAEVRRSSVVRRLLSSGLVARPLSKVEALLVIHRSSGEWRDWRGSKLYWSLESKQPTATISFKALISFVTH